MPKSLDPPQPAPESSAVAASRRARRTREAGLKGVAYLVLSAGAITMLAPLAWMISTSLKEQGALFTFPPQWVPTTQVQVDCHQVQIIDDQPYELYSAKAEGEKYVVGRTAGTREGPVRIVEPIARAGETLESPGGLVPIRSESRVYTATVNGAAAQVAEIKLFKGGVWVRKLADLEPTSEIITVPAEGFTPLRKLHFKWHNYVDAWHALELDRPVLAFTFPYVLHFDWRGTTYQWPPEPLGFRGFAIKSAFAGFYLNSIFVAVCVTFGQVFTSSLAAYAFARINFPGRDKVFLGYLATLMIPGVVTMIPVFILLRYMQLIDTYSAMILPAMFTAYGTFLLRQFFLSIPPELEDAARIDGATRLQIYWRIIMPLSKPALATLTTFTFLGSWNAFMWPLIVINSLEKNTLMLGLNSFMGQYNTRWDLLMGASVIVMLPVVLVFIFNQRYFVRGIVLSGLKG